MTEQGRIAELEAHGARFEKREDHYGETKTGWWLDGVWLGDTSRAALEAIRG